MEQNELSTMAGLQRRQMAQELSACNEMTARYGLTLSGEQVSELIENRFEALRDNGRVEFGEGILPRLITAFCDSPYLSQESYAEMLAGLQECFYYYKSASEDRFSDDELLAMMREAFDGEAEGSLEYLSGTTLDELCRSARFGEGRTDGALARLCLESRDEDE